MSAWDAVLVMPPRFEGLGVCCTQNHPAACFPWSRAVQLTESSAQSSDSAFQTPTVGFHWSGSGGINAQPRSRHWKLFFQMKLQAGARSRQEEEHTITNCPGSVNLFKSKVYSKTQSNKNFWIKACHVNYQKLVWTPCAMALFSVLMILPRSDPPCTTPQH